MKSTFTPEAALAFEAAPLVNLRYLAAAIAALAIMVGAILAPGVLLLNFIHVLFGLLWTGIDLFMGFVIGPVLRAVSLDARRQIITRLMPRMLYLMTTLSIVTGTTGWYLADRMGLTSSTYALFPWVVAALVIVTILTIQGIGILLPTNLKVFLELRKREPDAERIGRWMRIYVTTVAMQGLLQVAIIVVMARLRMG
ncbi:MAG: hypothetical protein ACKVQT_09760 [Burkholderiales bacterium]